MKIYKAEHMGFCFGVKKAIKKARLVLNEVNTKEDIYMLGEIIHNPQVIEEFIKNGVKIVNQISQVPEGKHLITRAHGILASELKYAKEKNIRIIDTTCPYVRKLHKIIKTLKNDGYKVIIYGDYNHPEIKSVLSFINNNGSVIQHFSQIEKNHSVYKGKVGVISQTTKDIKSYKKLLNKLFDYSDEIRVFNTICKATIYRQDATRKLAKKVDLVIVVGGLNSANTTRLASISRKVGVKTYHIEREEQLEKSWFKNKNKVGITSGASTPDYITENVIKKIEQIYSEE